MKGWKTMAVAAAIAVGGVLEAADWVDLVGPEYEGYAIIIIAAVMAGLRAVTNTRMGKSE